MDDHLITLIDDDTPMIKYLREKIIGRSSISVGVDDSISFNAKISPVESNDEQQKVILVKTNSNDQVSDSTRQNVSLSSPIIIPKKPSRSNTLSPSSAASTADQMISLGDLSTPLCQDADDTFQTILPVLPSANHQLGHRAALDRIAVKNKSRQPLTQKPSAVNEIDDRQTNLFSTTSTEAQHEESTTKIEAKTLQPLIEVMSTRAPGVRSRNLSRSRERSEGNLLTIDAKNPSSGSSDAASALANVLQRSLSLKRPQDMSATKFKGQPLLPIKPELETKTSVQTNPKAIETSTDQEYVTETSEAKTPSISSSSSQEHIYDNLDMFKHRKASPSPKPTVDSKPPVCEVKTREHNKNSVRLRPITVHISASETTSPPNEFEQIFNQLKKRGSIRKVRVPDEQAPVVNAPVEDSPKLAIPSVENDSAKPLETSSNIPPAPIRRKTLTGMQISSNNKVAADESKPSPSWIDIAKQKQTKLQSTSNEATTQQVLPTPSPSILRKTPSPGGTQPNRMSLYDSSNGHPVERDSIRALKNGNPNRINTLIQFFDK